MKLLTILVKLLLGGTTKNSYSSVQDFLTQMMLEQQMQQQIHQDMETARMVATGMEFGGFNPDPAMNPGMMSTMMNNGMF